MGRFNYLHVEGILGYARVNGIVVKDTDTQFLFFVSKDHRLHDAGWVFGGIPISMCPNEEWWNNVCRYCLGTKELEDFSAALHDCGCGMLSQMRWELDERFSLECKTCDEKTEREMDALLQYTINRAYSNYIPRRPNTDYECATQVYPWRTGSDRVGEGSEAARAEGDEPRTSVSIPSHLDDIMSDEYSEDMIYSGFHGYHAHHGGAHNTAVHGYGDEGYMVGVELEVECKNQHAKDVLNDVRSNWFYQERDGSLGDYGVELITIPLRPVDARSVEFWKTLTDPVGKVATSWDRETTGLHVHLSRSILGDTAEQRSETLGKLLYFYHHLVLDGGVAERKNKDIYGRATTYRACDGKAEVGSAAKALGSAALKHRDVSELVKRGMISKSYDGGERYFDINLQNEETIEFRKGKGSIKPECIVMIVAWSELMCLYCRETKWENLNFDGFRSYVRDSALTPVCLRERV